MTGRGPGAVVPEEAVEVPVPHVFKDHEQRAALCADAEEAHNVLVLEHGEQLSLALEVLPGALGRLLQRLDGRGRDIPGCGPSLDHPASQLAQHPPPSRELCQVPASPLSPILSALSWHDRALGGGPWTSNTSWPGSYLDSH